MQPFRTVLVSTLGLALAAQGVAPVAPVAADPGPRADAPVKLLQASRADSVVDGYGVGIHLNFLNTPYADAGAVASALTDLGVRHVRDDLYLDSPREYAAIRTVADRGIGFDLIMGRPGTSATPADYVDTVADHLPTGSVESLEGVNEWDLIGGDDWVSQMKDWQHGLYTAAKADPATADLPVLSPALAFKSDYATAGDMSADADIANAHMYPGGYLPSNQIGAITKALRTSIPDKPLITTEAGYHNAMSSDSGNLPVPEDVAGVYLPRLLLEHVGRGDKRMYSYELIDEFDDPDHTNSEAAFGLLHHDLTPKPAYTSMKALLGLMSDPGPSFDPGSLGVAADGLPSDARYLLTQKRDGEFVLLLWRDVSVYDPQTQQPLSVAPSDVTLRFAGTQDMTVYRPSEGTGAVSETTGTSLPLKLDGEVTAVTIDPVKAATPPAPTDVTATRGDRSATVTWKLPDTRAAVTGFEVTRAPGGVTQTLGSGARGFHDTGLTNGSSYTYSVRTLTADGSSATITSPAVVPAGLPTAPVIRSVKAGKHSVTLTWQASDGQGVRVIGYRLTVLGQVLSVGPDKRRATVKHLPSGKRLRVAVRAWNSVGSSRAAYTAYVRTKR